jgi:hypothetical protein
MMRAVCDFTTVRATAVARKSTVSADFEMDLIFTPARFSLLPSGEGGAKRRMRVGSLINIGTMRDARRRQRFIIARKRWLHCLKRILADVR